MSTVPETLLRNKYEREAQRYLASLPPEHFMEATPQATQREITLESLALVHAQRPDIQRFNELLVLYPLDKEGRELGRVVPDNMVVVHDEPIDAKGSFNLPLQPAGPFWTLEYVSKESSRKDYDDYFRRYEQHLRVPYYLLFAPDEQEMNLFRLNKRNKYVSVRPDKDGLSAIPELEMGVALVDEWVRYWFRGEMLPLPDELLAQRNEERQARLEERQARLAAEEEVDRLKEEIARLRAGKDE